MQCFWFETDRTNSGCYVKLAPLTEFFSTAVKNVMQIFLLALQIVANWLLKYDIGLEPIGQI